MTLSAAVTALHFFVHRGVVETGWSVPIDDTYIHFQYARGIAEGHPFAYHQGDGYSTGCTSPLYVALLALPQLVGLGDLKMIPVSLVLGGVWLTATMLLLIRIGRQLGNRPAGVAAAAIWAGWGFTWYCLYSGMETGLYLTLLLAVLSLFVSWTQERTLRRPWWPLLVLAALLPLGRPEGLFLLAVLLAVAAGRIVLRPGCLSRAGATDRLRLVGWWSLTLLPVVAYFVANRILTGTYSTAGMISKSLLYVPYIKPTEKVVTFLSHLFEAMRQFLSGKDANFLGFAVAGPGLVAVVALALREQRRRLMGSRTVLAAWALVMLAAASMHYIRIARWERYYMPLFLLAILGAGFAVTWLARAVHRPWLAPAAVAVLILFQGDSTMRWVKAYERDLKTIETKQAAAARSLLTRTPADARVLVCDAGAIPYISRRQTFDIVGLTTPLRHNYFRNGMGSRFELFERIPAGDRPDFVAAYDFCLWPGARGVPLSRHHDMIVAPVAEKQAGSGHMPAILPRGTRVIDRIDVADLASEHEHRYGFDPPGNIRDNVVRRGRTEGRAAPIADGGRLIRQQETFRFHAGPGRDALLIGRYASVATQLALELNGKTNLYAKLRGTPHGAFTEVSVTIPKARLGRDNTLRVRTLGAPYHSFHYFVVQ